MSVDWIIETARKVCGVPDGWRWHTSTVGVPGGKELPVGTFRVQGGIPQRFFTKGKRKGRPDWKCCTEARVVFFTREDITRVQQEWERETGKCAQCEGSGQEWAGYNVRTGDRFRKCLLCGGSGKRCEVAA